MGVFHFDDASFLRVNNKHIWWKSKEILWLVIVAAEKPITLKYECSLRLRHLLNWVWRAVGGQKVPVFIIVYGSDCECSNKEGQIEKGISLQIPASISQRHQREKKEARGPEEIWDEFCSSLQDRGWKYERLPLINVCPRSHMQL